MAVRPLNILFLNSIDKTTWGGLENWIEMCASGLSDRGHNIFVAGRNDSHFLRRMRQHEEIQTGAFDIAGDFNPVTVMRIKNFCCEKAVDIAFCNFVKDVRLAGLARKFGRRKFKLIWTPGVNLAKKTLSHKWLFSSFVDCAIVPSRQLCDDIVASGYIPATNFHVVPVGIDSEKWQADRDASRRWVLERFNLPPDAFICLTSGRFVPQKGHYYLIEAAARLIRTHKNIFFLLLGEGPLREDLARRINEHHLTDHFIFCGLLDNHVPAVFGSDLYVHPAVIEPFGIVLVEAMAASLPVVASNVGGIPEVIEENKTAVLVEPAHPKQLEEAILRFHNDRSLLKEFGRAGFERYKQYFTMDKMIAKVAKIAGETVQ